jgi:hypothetical protein
MTAHAEYLDLCAAMALRSLPSRDERRLIEHVAGGCPECEAALEDYGTGGLIVARGAPPTRPGPALRGAVMADASLAHMSRSEKMRQVPGPRTTVGAPNWALLFVPAAIIAAIVAVMFWNETRQLKAQMVETQGMIARLSGEMAEASKWQSVVAGPDARAVTLAARSGLRATVFHSPGTHRAILVASGLEPAGGERYVLWASGVTPAPLGAVVPDNTGRATLRVERVADGATGFLLTREAAGAGLPATPRMPAVAEGRTTP